MAVFRGGCKRSLTLDVCRTIPYLKLRDNMQARVVWRSAHFGAACYEVGQMGRSWRFQGSKRRR